jgi:hypothetical protein
MPLFDDNSDIRTSEPSRGQRPGRRFDPGRMRPADLYDAWLFAEADATLAMAAWWSARDADKPDAHAAYLAALDRETHAAEALELGVRGSIWSRVLGA